MNSQEKYKILRQKANEILKNRAIEDKEQYFRDFDKLIEELNIHQIELELQNTELERSKEVVEIEKNKYYSLFEFAPVSYFTINQKSNIKELNRKAVQLIDTAKRNVLGLPFYAFVKQEYKTIFYNHLKQVFQNGSQTHQCEIAIINSSGDEYFLQLQSIMYTDEESREHLCRMAATNITRQKQSEQSLRESRQKYSILVETLPYSILEIDKDGYIRYCNRANQKILGYETNQLTEKHVTDLLYDKKRKQTINKALYAVSQDKAKPTTYFEQLKTASGEPIDIQADWSYNYNQDGELSGFIAIITDITQKKRIEEALKESERKFRQLADNTNDVFFIRTLDKQLLYVNKAFHKLFGISSVNFHSTPDLYFDWVHPDDQIKVKAVIENENLINQKDYELQYRIVHPDNSIHWIWLRSFPIKDTKNQIYRIAGIITDITKQKENELQLLQATKKAEQSDSLKTAFLNNISHQIRTPMNAIIGFAELLIIKDFDGERRRKYLQLISDRTRHLLNILDDIIDLSKIKAGIEQININTFKLNNILKELKVYYDNHKKIRENKALTFNVKPGLPDGEDSIATDRTKLHEIFANLIDNAIKFTETGEITVGYTMENENQIQFFIKDTGIGLEDEMKSLIFDEFKKIDESNTRPLDGTGVGLTITKELVQLLHGSIWLDSKVNQGTVFYFTIPREANRLFNKKMLVKTNIKPTYNELHFAINQAAIVSITDKAGNIIFANDKFCRSSQYTQDELIGQNHRILNSDYHPSAFFTNLWKTISHGEVWQNEIRNKNKSGSFYWVYTTIIPFSDDQQVPYQYWSIRFDITRRVQIEKQLADTNTTKDKLFRLISNNLKKNISVLKNNLELITYRKDLSKSNYEEHIQKMNNNADEAYILLENLLEWTKCQLPEQKFRKEFFLLNEIIEQVKEQVIDKKVLKDITFTSEIHESIIVHANKKLVYNVLKNLLLNALKFVPQNEKILLTVKTVEQLATIEIIITGFGVSQVQKKNFFDPDSYFSYKFNNKENKAKIGLLLCKSLIENNGGNLQINSLSDLKTGFIFTIPIN